MIRIGVWSNEAARWQAGYVQEQLHSVGADAEWFFIADAGGDSSNAGGGHPLVFGAIEEALMRGDIDAAVHPLHYLPSRLAEGLVITAVSLREDPADCLLIRRAAVTPGNSFLLAHGAVLGVTTALRRTQMEDFRPDLSFRDLPGAPTAWIAQLSAGDCDAILLDASLIRGWQPNLSAFELRRLSPREVVPAPGQGALAYLTLSHDLTSRRLLRQIHHPDVSALTNIERQVLRLLGGNGNTALGAYCESDPQGNYHVWAAFAGRPGEELRRVRLSSSTRYGLAEQVAEELGKS